MTSAHDILKRAYQWKSKEFFGLVLVMMGPLLLPSKSLLINEIVIVALFAISLDLIVGYTGIASLGHAAFFGMGAYSAALFAKFVMPDPLVGLGFAIVVSTILGLLCSVTVLRGPALTGVMVTLGVSLMLFELANKLDWLTGGADGLGDMVVGPLLGVLQFDQLGRVAAYYSISVSLVFFLLVRRLVCSPFCATLIAVRDNRLRAAAIGVPVNHRIIAIYTIAAGIAGAAGALLAQTNNFVSLDVFDTVRSADVLLMLVIGGTGWLYGGVLGAVAFKVLQDVLAQISPQYWLFWLGLFLVVLIRMGRYRFFRPWLWIRRGA